MTDQQTLSISPLTKQPFVSEAIMSTKEINHLWSGLTMKNPLKLVVGSHTGGIDPFSSFGFEVNPAVR